MQPPGAGGSHLSARNPAVNHPGPPETCFSPAAPRGPCYRNMSYSASPESSGTDKNKNSSAAVYQISFQAWRCPHCHNAAGRLLPAAPGSAAQLPRVATCRLPKSPRGWTGGIGARSHPQAPGADGRRQPQGPRSRGTNLDHKLGTKLEQKQENKRVERGDPRAAAP